MAETEKRRVQRMRARKLRDLGRPVFVFPHEFERAYAVVRAAHEAGMSYTKMAEQVGMDRTSIRNIGERVVKTMRRPTYEKLLALRVEPDEIPLGKTKRNAGAKIDPTGSLRRLRALLALGLSAEVIGDHLDMWPSAVRTMANGQPRFVYAVMAVRIAEVYDKLRDTRPEDFGIRGQHIRGNRRKAWEKGWGVPDCWDDDTIDDPDAHPEWTGACGTEEGYRIHIRETIFRENPLPPCARCRQAVETRPPAPTRFILNRERLAQALGEHRLTVKAIARQAMPDLTPETARDTLYRWRDGSRSPKTLGHVKPLADVLGLAVEDLVDYEAMEVEADREVVANGVFNPHFLTVALELAGLTFRGAAEIIPASDGAIMKWARGEMKPSDKTKLIPLADHLGVDVEVFYS